MICPFCTIDKEKTRVVHKTALSFVALSNPHLMPGHILVIPRRHVERLVELNGEERMDLFHTLVKMQEKILQKFSRGCDIRQNMRPFLPQGRLKVDHVHFHLQPREFKDDLYEKSQKFEADIFQDLTEEEEEKFTGLFGE